MNSKLTRRLSGGALIALLLLGVFILNRHSFKESKAPVEEGGIPIKQRTSSKNRAELLGKQPSLITKQDSLQEGEGISYQAEPSFPRAHREDPYAKATVLNKRESPARPDGTFRREKVVQANFKYPYILVDETLARDALGKEQVLHRTEMVADHVVVKLRKGMTKDHLESLAKRYGALIRKTMLAPNTFIVQLQGHEVDTVSKAVAQFTQEASTIAYAEPDYIVYPVATPNDTDFGKLWGLHNTGQAIPPGGATGTADADIDAPEAWDVFTGSKDTKVGVIDTGVDYNHPDLKANMWTNPGEIAGNNVDDDGNGFVDDVHGWDFANDDKDPMDGHDHGTHCSGTIGGVGNNGVGVAGVSWNVSIVAIKFLSDSGGGTTSDGVDSIYYATKVGVHLTSNSWGGGGFSQALKDAIEDANAKGILFVGAAGNSGLNADTSPMYPAAYDNANIISVAAMDHKDLLAYFSNYGATSVDLGAPGVNVYSTTAGNTYQFFSGTSMACPHVAGACALVKSLAPSLSHSDIKSFILGSVDSVPALVGKSVTGGRLNIEKALKYLTGPYITTTQVVLDDDSVNGTIGNQNGILNPGETIGFDVTARNVGSDPTTGVTGTLSLQPAVAGISITQATSSFGDLASRAAATGSTQYRVQIGSSVVTPKELNFVLNFQDASGNSWTSSFKRMLYTSSQITGTVVKATGGAPIAGAKVHYTGPVSGIATAAADGTYKIDTINGVYTLIAKATGVLDSDPRTVSTPPSAANINFSLGIPDISASVASLSGTAKEGEASSQSFTISNLGDVNLNYSLHPGPYDFQHSDQPGGPTYSWIDISATGTPITLGDDVNKGPFNIGFDFPFFGQTFKTFRVSSNGFISFTDTSAPYWNIGLPSASAPKNLVAFFWSVLYFGTSSRAYYNMVDANTLVVQFKDVEDFWDSTKKVSCEAILKSDGSVLFQYQRVDLPDYATVGIQNAAGDQGLQVAYNSKFIHSNLAVRIRPGKAPWVVTSSSPSIVAPSGSRTHTVSLDAKSLDAGTHTSRVVILSNDPDESRVEIPVTFTVTAAPRFVHTASVVNDDSTIPSSGDGDTAAEVGETIELQVSVKNTGHEAASGITGVLTTSSSHLQILSNQGNFGDAGIGQVVTGNPKFQIKILSTASTNYKAPLSLTLTDSIGRSWTVPFELPIISPCAVPTNLAAYSYYSDRLWLIWADNSNNETGFKIERKLTGSADPFVQVQTVGANVYYVYNTGLTPNTAYTYRVRATNTGGDSAYSNEATATTKTAVTIVATDALASEAGSNPGLYTITRTGSTASPLTVAITVFGDAKNGTDYQTIGTSVTIPAGSSSATISILPINDTAIEGLEYVGIYLNYSADYDTPTPWYDYVDITDDDKPVAPSNLTATAVSTTKVNLSWVYSATGATGFKIERKQGPTGAYSQIASVGASARSYSNMTVVAGTQYFYRVKATSINGDSPYSNEAEATANFAVFVGALAAGENHSLAVGSDGKVWGFGQGTYGQLGTGTKTSSLVPVQIAGFTASEATAGRLHSVAVKSDGTVWAWGYNGYGQLGLGTTSQTNFPVKISSLTGIQGIDAGHYHSTAVGSDGKVWTWGNGEKGQLGDGYTNKVQKTPIQAQLTGVATQVVAGLHHTAALKTDGTVWAWGYNKFGQMGRGYTNEFEKLPVQVLGLSNVDRIAAGDYFNLALKKDGTVWAWGYGGNGRLGNNAGTNAWKVVQVLNLSSVLDVAAGAGQGIALRSDGTVWTWGYNSAGQLGNGTILRQLKPVQANNLLNIRGIAAGSLHSLALKSDGTVWSFGNNAQGQLGNNSTLNQSNAVQVTGLDLISP
jgi:alpha-tubulin suppressor-like RCC1 family protein/subtilisin family serine protease